MFYLKKVVILDIIFKKSTFKLAAKSSFSNFQLIVKMYNTMARYKPYQTVQIF